MSRRYNSVLSIAGSDSGGCAGIQADIKSISANGAYAATVITATTAQNTQGVSDIHPIPVPHIQKQLEAVLSDIEFGAVKIGMLHSSEVIDTVKEMLASYRVDKIILDPVMVATSGDMLITDEAIVSLKKFISNVYLVTPNIPEAEILLGQKILLENMKDAAFKISEQYNVSVLLKGGHLEQSDVLVDILCVKESKKIIEIKNKVIATKNTHGTGCSLSSSIAAFISLGFGLEEATLKACHYIHKAIESGKDKVLGKGNGPINHFLN